MMAIAQRREFLAPSQEALAEPTTKAGLNQAHAFPRPKQRSAATAGQDRQARVLEYGGS